ncbi:MAG: M23 family metallopeptidase [Thermodesulfobacteriota bacterium]
MKFKRKDRGKSIKYWLLAIAVLAVVLPALWVLITRMEGTPPAISLEQDQKYLQVESTIAGRVSDAKSGVRNFRAALVADGREIVLKDADYDTGMFSGEDERKDVSFELKINTKKLGLPEGKALLQLSARDGSWRHWLSGNRAYMEKEIVIDTRPPRLSVLSRQHNISQGGSGLVIYKLSEPCKTHGIVVGENFFPGHKGYFQDKEMYLAFFALAHTQGKDTDLYVRAVDAAGNAARSGIDYHIRSRRFKNDTLTVSDRFLRKILPEFDGVDLNPDAPMAEQFLQINRELRKKNNQAIRASCGETDRQLHWKGAFKRLPNSARRASFADHRSYQYNGDVIDRQIHLGVDLASLKQAPIPAANAGRVTFVGRVGIYGNMVTIDHGFGVFSLYAHLSQSRVKAGDMVDKGDIIGRTGSTGLTDGDHLHFGMIVDDVFVNPVEWWDAAWIQNNITAKLENAAN